MMFAARAVALVLALALGGCAVVGVLDSTIDPLPEAWTVRTEPGEAMARTSLGIVCDQTPCTFELARNSDFDVTITKPGYATAYAHVGHPSDATGGGLASGVGGLVGGLSHLGSTGLRAHLLSPNPLDVTLRPLPAASKSP